MRYAVNFLSREPFVCFRRVSFKGESEKLVKKIYVGNLPYEATEDEVREMFAEFGEVQSVAMINDRDTGRFRGFSFVEMDDEAANDAIEALDGKDVGGRSIKVNEARPREERGGGRRDGGRNRRGGGRERRGGRDY